MPFVDTETGLALGAPDSALIERPHQVTADAVASRLDSLILSASGWRGVFAADGDEESTTEQVSAIDLALVALTARVFAEHSGAGAHILVGIDARPTGSRIAESALRAFIDLDIRVHYLFICAAPQIMAYASGGPHQGTSKTADRPFYYVTASHNPVGHNGIKVGAGGSVMSGPENANLVERLRGLAGNTAAVRWAASLLARPESRLAAVFRATDGVRRESRQAYGAFLDRVVAGDGPRATAALTTLRHALAQQAVGVVAELNGSARATSIDVTWLAELGCRVHAINDRPRAIVHRIVPEGESLNLCREALGTIAASDSGFVLGYVPDNDGDRGNLVYIDERTGETAALDAQSVFALACVSELAWMIYTGALTYAADGTARERVAVVVNGPTSVRVEEIGAAFGVEVHRAEVGEANVVGLARELRGKDYAVRILGEGSNGGNITHPSAVRDPMATVVSVLKLLAVPASPESPSPLSLWLRRRSTQDTGTDATGQQALAADAKPSGTARIAGLAAVLATLPPFTTTGAYEPEAKLQISTTDHAALKRAVESRFATEWGQRLPELRRRLGVTDYRVVNHEGLRTFDGPGNRSGAERGGLKFLLSAGERPLGFLWMRGSGTEPVFRVMVDVAGANNPTERWLLDWFRSLIQAADAARGEGRMLHAASPL